MIEIHILSLATSSPLVVVTFLVIKVLVQLILLISPQVKLSLTFPFQVMCCRSKGHLVVPLSLLLLLLLRVGKSILVVSVIPALLLLSTSDLIYQYVQH